MENTICHAEIPVTDLNKAKEFYSKVFEWKIEVMPEMNYATFETGTPPGGGFNKVDMVKPGGVLFYIMVENIEKKLEKIEEAGGKTVSGKSEIPNVGWMALFSDVFGNVLGLFKPMQK
jgi:hypothetical protein